MISVSCDSANGLRDAVVAEEFGKVEVALGEAMQFAPASVPSEAGGNTALLDRPDTAQLIAE